MKKLYVVLITLIIFSTAAAQDFNIKSPDGNVSLSVKAGKQLEWAVAIKGQSVIEPSPISLTLATGEVLGTNAKATGTTMLGNSVIRALNYKKDTITDSYRQLTVRFKNNFSVIFRAYNEGAAYRFVLSRKDSVTITRENVNFKFSDDYSGYFPYVNDAHNKDVFECSFENVYQHIKISEFKKDTLAFAPVLVELPNGVKAGITEADLEEYPGMFIGHSTINTLTGVFAPYPIEEKEAGRNSLVVKRADFIARTAGTRSFPWRVVIISSHDTELLNNDMVYKLGSPSRLNDVSWIKPGKVAWDWWNDWNIKGVDFKAGVNTETYKFYVDFAAANKIEYILLDEGWADAKDIMKVIPDIDLKQIVEYGKSKNVGVWLWGGWLPLDRQMDKALKFYADLGIKGFKVDFMDRDDQKIVAYYYRLAKKAAASKLMVDFHGAYKPTGLQRTYPNVMNFEGVRGLENTKWSNPDFPRYECTIPFIRMLAGPMDYTPGAMKNATKNNFRAIYAAPMSQGTRCHQLALYVILEAPFEMLADNPSNYIAEPVSTQLISGIPTTFDETRALDGQVGEYAIIARRKGTTWYVAALGNWNPREIALDLSFLGKGSFDVEIFSDGINANRDATDFKKTSQRVTGSDKLAVKLAPGGGWVGVFKIIY